MINCSQTPAWRIINTSPKPNYIIILLFYEIWPNAESWKPTLSRLYIPAVSIFICIVKWTGCVVEWDGDSVAAVQLNNNAASRYRYSSASWQAKEFYAIFENMSTYFKCYEVNNYRRLINYILLERL